MKVFLTIMAKLKVPVGNFESSSMFNDKAIFSDGIWTYTWNGENRLITIENFDMKLEFAYDYLGILTHMWQDYYAHGIVMNSDGSTGTIGSYSGSPDSPTMKPSSWGGMFNTGEHRGFLSYISPWSHVGPGAVRKTQEFAEQFLKSILG